MIIGNRRATERPRVRMALDLAHYIRCKAVNLNVAGKPGSLEGVRVCIKTSREHQRINAERQNAESRLPRGVKD